MRGWHRTGKILYNFGNSKKEVLFQDSDVQKVLRLLEVDLDTRIKKGRTLLFLDEIQAAPEVFAKLRYLYEKEPELHVICAGSLLDFILADHDFSMPVGRIEYMYLGPMTFEEFLAAEGRKQMAGFLGEYWISDPIPESIHLQLINLLKDYFALGGMPGVLHAYFASQKDYLVASLEQQSLIQTCYDDFTKYSSKTDIPLLQRVFRQVPQQIGAILKYVNLDRDAGSSKVKACLELLEKSRLLYRVCHSAGNGVPLESEKVERRFKLLFLDIGLMNSMMGMKVSDLAYSNDLTAVHAGALAEQFVEQHLLYSGLPIEDPSLFFWMRCKKGASSELDYLISHKGRVVPVEVKAGKTGRLKSLQIFVADKGLDLALRFNSEPPSLSRHLTSIPGKPVKPFQLLSLPMYLAGQTRRILEDVS
jgi:uncharacterized protein